MYRIGRRSKKKTKRYIWVVVLLMLLALCAAAAYVAYMVLSEADETISTPQAITREYAPPQGEDTKEFIQQGLFTITLPSDWVLKGHNETPHNLYSYQATEKNEDNRWLEIYVDRVPTDAAFNKLLPVIIENNKIVVTGSVSENCIEFTGPQGNPRGAGVDSLPAKWQGVDFLCDLSNYTRNVVGVGTVAAKHNIVLNGPTAGQHTFYFKYIDHNISPDYQILEKALQSFTVP
jgi:hypothetical protein